MKNSFLFRARRCSPEQWRAGTVERFSTLQSTLPRLGSTGTFPNRHQHVSPIVMHDQSSLSVPDLVLRLVACTDGASPECDRLIPRAGTAPYCSSSSISLLPLLPRLALDLPRNSLRSDPNQSLMGHEKCSAAHVGSEFCEAPAVINGARSRWGLQVRRHLRPGSSSTYRNRSNGPPFTQMTPQTAAVRGS